MILVMIKISNKMMIMILTTSMIITMIMILTMVMIMIMIVKIQIIVKYYRTFIHTAHGYDLDNSCNSSIIVV